jgi:predicted dehydrogenase
MRDLLAAGEIGRPLSVRAHWGEYLPGWHPWEDYRQGYSARLDLGGGVVLTLSHPLDYLRWLFGEVAALWAFTGKNSDLELQVEDSAEIGLRFASGMLGSLHLDYNQRPASHWLEAIGSQGTLHWDNLSGEVRVFQSEIGSWQFYPPPTGFERNDLFLAEMRHFLQVARGEAEPICSLADGIHALQLALAVHDSQQQGKLIYL